MRGGGLSRAGGTCQERQEVKESPRPRREINRALDTAAEWLSEPGPRHPAPWSLSSLITINPRHTHRNPLSGYAASGGALGGSTGIQQRGSVPRPGRVAATEAFSPPQLSSIINHSSLHHISLGIPGPPHPRTSTSQAAKLAKAQCKSILSLKLKQTSRSSRERHFNLCHHPELSVRLFDQCSSRARPWTPAELQITVTPLMLGEVHGSVTGNDPRGGEEPAECAELCAHCEAGDKHPDMPWSGEKRSRPGRFWT
ncbi:unnamed protein product [Pleuronectes platessa]|uniref:Uncharacterized protein n=1 Tax=Pleuronectes platessa TaxID=8262 RepID=A0A9N7TV84_PLEPL|nr:unnamed protein product [Pleuronectes platessa]